MNLATTICRRTPTASSLVSGRIGRIRENETTILPNAMAFHSSDLQHKRENQEDSQQLYTCAGAHAPVGIEGMEDPPNPPFSPARWGAGHLHEGVRAWD